MRTCWVQGITSNESKDAAKADNRCITLNETMSLVFCIASSFTSAASRERELRMRIPPRCYGGRCTVKQAFMCCSIRSKSQHDHWAGNSLRSPCVVQSKRLQQPAFSTDKGRENFCFFWAHGCLVDVGRVGREHQFASHHPFLSSWPITWRPWRVVTVGGLKLNTERLSQMLWFCFVNEWRRKNVYWKWG